MNLASLKRPRTDEIEVTIFGPGFGESIVVHAGNDEWIIVDSCVDSGTGKPAALAYLEGIQVDPSTSVKLIVATHWHDDHIAGMSELVHVCESAIFACSMALTRGEFLEAAKAYAGRQLDNIPSGSTEIFQTLTTVKGRQQFPKYATADRPLFRMQRAGGGGLDWEVTALSPVDGELQRFLASIAAMIPLAGVATAKSRLPNPGRNDLSIATWIKIGDVQVLLGADLEEHGVAGRGWTAVLASATRPPGVATLFKISHHGSANGHHDGIWSTMLSESPIAVLTPWTLAGNGLPQPEDVQRIKGFTSNAYSTSRLNAGGVSSLSQVARRTFREGGVRIRQSEPPTGYLQFRASADGATVWAVTASADAVRL